MNRQRKFLLYILSGTIALSFLFFFSLQIKEIQENKKRISTLYERASEASPSSTQIVQIEEYLSDLKIELRGASSDLLPENELSFFDFTNLITKGAESSGLEIINYKTDIKKTVPSLTISGEGSISGILSFLLLLDTYSDTVRTYYLMIRFNTFKNIYNLTASLNYLVDEENQEGAYP